MTGVTTTTTPTRRGDHVCLVYDDPRAPLRFLVPFVLEGLRARERCVWVLDDLTPDDARDSLAPHVDPSVPIRDGALRLWTRDQWRPPGELVVETRLAEVRAMVDESLAEGFRGLRFAIEMTWATGPDLDPTLLERWEATLDGLFSDRLPVRMICQYGRRRLSPATVRAGLRTHPLAHVDGVLGRNPMYDTSIGLSGGAEGQLDNMLAGVRRSLANEADLADLVERAPMPIHGVDAAGLLHYANQAELDLMRSSREDYLGRRYADFHADPARAAAILARLRRGETVADEAARLRRDDGSEFEALIDANARAADDGTMLYSRGFTRDVSEWRRAERDLRALAEELERKVRARTADLEASHEHMAEFTYSVSHDLSSPVRAIRGYADMLREDLGERLDDDARRHLDRIVASVTRMDVLIRDLVAYSRVSRAELAQETLELVGALDAALAEMECDLDAAGARVARGGPWPGPIVHGHRATLVQVIAGVLSNAIKFVPPGEPPRIEIAWRYRPDHAVLEVRDHGIGIAPEHRDRIFRVFERLHGEGAYPGTGVGLAVARRAVERMGGRIDFDSQPGDGCRFWIEMPLARGVAAKATTAPNAD